MIEPQPRANYHLSYDAAWLERGDYLSDSGHVWSQPFESVCRRWPNQGQLHMLVHPDWWVAAFPVAVAACSSLWFIVPAHGRVDLARICLTQLRRHLRPARARRDPRRRRRHRGRREPGHGPRPRVRHGRP